MKIAIANVKYSANVGDGLLSECLEFGLNNINDMKFDISSCDLAGRTRYCTDTQARSTRKKYLQILDSTPKMMRRFVLRTGLSLKSVSWRKHYDCCIGDAEAVVIGGGNLFTDVDLNFPTKISVLLNLAKQRRQPIYIYGIGVGDVWSKRGLEILREALKNSDIRTVAVRDRRSQKNFIKYFGDIVKQTPVVVRDPGLITSEVYELDDGVVLQGVGICLTSPAAISYHSNISVSNDFLLNWYERLYSQLTEGGARVEIFTNGDEEDNAFASDFCSFIKAKKGIEIELFSPQTPTELASYIGNMQAVVAFRMHALICAYSLGKRIVALMWDPKVESLMASLGLKKYLVDVNTVEVADVCSLVLLESERSDSNCISVQEEALNEIGDLAKNVQSLSVRYQ